MSAPLEGLIDRYTVAMAEADIAASAICAELMHRRSDESRYERAFGPQKPMPWPLVSMLDGYSLSGSHLLARQIAYFVMRNGGGR